LMRVFVSRSFSSSPTSTLTRRIRFGCCGHAVSGQTAAEPAITLMKSRRLICRLRGLGQGIVAVERKLVKGPDVRFGSLADICSAQAHVRFTPNSDRESGLPAKVMSALPPKADICGAQADVCFGPIADIASTIRKPRPRARLACWGC